MKPISSVNFGSGSPTLRCTAIVDMGTGVETCFIVKQTGAKKYTLTGMTSAVTLTGCTLVEGTPAVLGDMNVAVTPFGGSALSAKKIMSNQVETYEDDARYSWLLGVAASAAGQATVQHN
jgi:hypothetical protein